MHKKLVSDSLIVSISTGLAKLTPILLGVFITNKFGGVEYSQFVSFLLLSNLVISVSALGCAPQILSLKHTPDSSVEFIKLTSLCFFIVLCSYAILDLDFKFFQEFFENIPLIYFLFHSLGLGFVYLCAARFNNKFNAIGGAKVWFGFIISSLLAIISAMVGFVDFSEIVPLLSIMSLLVGCGSVLYIVAKDWDSITSVEVSTFTKGMSIYFKNSLFMSIFGFVSVGVFLYSQRLIVSSGVESDSTQFSMFIQLYSVVTFVPTMLGNVVIPRLSNKSVKSWLVYAVYFLMAIIVLMPVNFFYEHVYNVYGISIGVGGYSSMFYFSVLAIVACVNSYSIQQAVAKNKFNYLLLYLFLLVCSLLLMLHIFENVNVNTIIISLATSYIVSAVGLYSLIKVDK
ncbi:hypothetical protein [Vibrio sinaloensis]|uniref:Polysaccharide biosynthesis protein n=1 Tax=Photobacterium sp. (strain ATCC 43367) TaxID=379097 RepID=A0A0A5HT21_PHOS4|nr:hypothetical protein [Vibrio sinaloensis]KGY07455.1 hypothetical protein NM06_16735 [Vibrio sinaloensis]